MENGPSDGEGVRCDASTDAGPREEHKRVLKSTLRAQAVDLSESRLRSLGEELLALKGLQKLCLRQNLLTSVGEVARLASAPDLLELDLRDNQYTELPCLRAFTALTHLDFSYNRARSLDPLEDAPPTLRELYLANNRFASVAQGLAHLTSLTLLELGSNRLPEIEGLAPLRGLAELWLGRNRLTSVQPLTSLQALRKLSLQSNRLAGLGGVEACAALEELYVSHNALTGLQEVAPLTRLRVLDAASNRLPALPDLSRHTQLQDLWVNDNAVGRLEDLTGPVASLGASLTCVYFHGNPGAGPAGAAAGAPGPAQRHYRTAVRAALPFLRQLDADLFPEPPG